MKNNLEDQLFEWEDKSIDNLPITELSSLQYVLEHLPAGISYTIKSSEGEFDYIDDYIEHRTDKFFEATEEDYKKLIGTCFINEDKSIVVKVVGIRDDYDDKYYEADHHVDNFLYEKYERYNDGTWHTQDYIWLQENAKGRFAEEEYLKWCLTSQTEMNINAEGMFMLGKDGNLYVDVSCGGDYEIFRPMSEATFELIREEAIRKDGEYKVDDK
jgi:hypothetical protein